MDQLEVEAAAAARKCCCGGCGPCSGFGCDQIMVRTPPASPMITVGVDLTALAGLCCGEGGGFISQKLFTPPISSGRTPFILHAVTTEEATVEEAEDTQNVGGDDTLL